MNNKPSLRAPQQPNRLNTSASPVRPEQKAAGQNVSANSITAKHDYRPVSKKSNSRGRKSISPKRERGYYKGYDRFLPHLGYNIIKELTNEEIQCQNMEIEIDSLRSQVRALEVKASLS